ncbi:minor capsid protein [Escherichia coli]|uniref:Minor capsid protein n=1 Tax=Escherichia coli TaxID=562 RepID=A0A376UFI5_ECOLX|nr:minor capsid protein [Escherichia coli]
MLPLPAPMKRYAGTWERQPPLHPVSSQVRIRGVFDDPENISYAGQGVRVEGSSPSLFVRTDEVRQLRRGDTLTIGEENFWVDRVSPDDGGSCHLWLGRGVPPAVNRRR